MIVGTAGHIDHGKTALVKALTGVDADRLKEEKARGITIDLGYAYSDLGDGRQLGFVDVPGHERFVHNMLAGATGIDAALLVVSVAEGIKPQTIEHLQIVDLLGIDRGIVALTKADLADDDQILERMAEVAASSISTSAMRSRIWSSSARSALVSATMPRSMPSRSTICRCSIVCGLMPSATDNNSRAASMPVAPASMLCTKRSWPGTSTKPSCRPSPRSL